MAYKIDTGWWFLAIPLKNMSSSVGMIINPRYGKQKNSKPPTRNTFI